MKILSIVGARPQFVKEQLFKMRINKFDDIQEVVVHTGNIMIAICLAFSLMCLI